VKEGDEGGDEEEHGDNDNGDDNANEPTSCFGHFDRLDVEYTPKPAAQVMIRVIHDWRVDDAWTSPPLLMDGGRSRRQDSVATTAAAAAERSIKRWEGRRTPTGDTHIVFDMSSDVEDDDEAPDRTSLSRTMSLEAEDPQQEQYDPPSPTLPSHSPRRVLKKLRRSHTAVRILRAEDPYFAGRLAQISVFMIHEGQMVEAERLGRWSVDLVGKYEWDRKVEDYGSEPRLETDNGELVNLLLDDLDMNLSPVDEARAAELRGMSLEWQDMGILPRRSTT